MPATLQIVNNDNPVPQSAARWLAGEICRVAESDTEWINGETPNGVFVYFTVTNRTVAEMEQYLATYVRDYDFTLIGQNADLRRYEIKNLFANTQGIGYWTQEAVDAIKAEWEDRYPLADITTIGFPNQDANGLGNIWDMSGSFTAGQGAEFQLVVSEKGSQHMDKRKTWYVSPTMMDNIRSAGGTQSGTSAQLAPNLKDSRLD